MLRGLLLAGGNGARSQLIVSLICRSVSAPPSKKHSMPKPVWGP